MTQSYKPRCVIYLMRILCSIILLGVFVGCKKEVAPTVTLASMYTANVVVNGKTARLNNYLRDSVNSMNIKTFTLAAGPGKMLYVFPSGDSLHPYYNATADIANGGLYSLFLTGNSATGVESVFVKDDVPSFKDSLCGVRFANMSPGSAPINVTLAATPTVNEFSSVAYKQVTAFKTYSATLLNNNYSIQIRDAGTNAVLATYTLVVPRFFACTLIWKGIAGGTGVNARGILRQNNY